MPRSSPPRRSPISKAPVRPAAGAGGVPRGGGDRPRRRPAGGAEPVRPVLRRAPPRRLPRPGRGRSRHPVRQRGGDLLALRDRRFRRRRFGALLIVCVVVGRAMVSGPERSARLEPPNRVAAASVPRASRSAVAAAIAYSAAIVGAGSGASSVNASLVALQLPASCGGRTATPSPRPRVATGAIPPITVHDAIDVATPISARVAKKIVGDVLADLAIQARAVERRDPRLVLAVARFPWVDQLVSTICSATGAVCRFQLPCRRREGRRR